MKHIQTLNTQILQNTVKKGGCGECQTSCQSACKTSLHRRQPDVRASQIRIQKDKVKNKDVSEAPENPGLLGHPCCGVAA